MNPQCEKCYWYGQCYSEGKCDDYFPAGYGLDESDDELIESGRKAFRAEWNEAVERHIFFANI